MAQETRNTIENEISTQFPDNNVKQITAADLRAFQLIMSDSKFNLLDDDIGSIKIDASDTNSKTLLHEINRLKELTKPYNLFYIDVKSTEEGTLDTNADFIRSNYPGASSQDVLIANDPSTFLNYPSILSTFGVSNIGISARYSLNDDHDTNLGTSFDPLPGVGHYNLDILSRVYTYRDGSGSPNVYYIRYIITALPDVFYEVDYL